LSELALQDLAEDGDGLRCVRELFKFSNLAFGIKPKPVKLDVIKRLAGGSNLSHDMYTSQDNIVSVKELLHIEDAIFDVFVDKTEELTDTLVAFARLKVFRLRCPGPAVVPQHVCGRVLDDVVKVFALEAAVHFAKKCEVAIGWG
jgi:hypothetical protein